MPRPKKPPKPEKTKTTKNQNYKNNQTLKPGTQPIKPVRSLSVQVELGGENKETPQKYCSAKSSINRKE